MSGSLSLVRNIERAVQSSVQRFAAIWRVLLSVRSYTTNPAPHEVQSRTRSSSCNYSFQRSHGNLIQRQHTSSSYSVLRSRHSRRYFHSSSSEYFLRGICDYMVLIIMLELFCVSSSVWQSILEIQLKMY